MATSTEPYSFAGQLVYGQSQESRLDRFFRNWYRVTPVSRELQRLGIDRIFTNMKNGKRYTIEYKADDTASRTRNVFIETVSVDIQKKPGWAYTSCAQLVIYFIPPDNKIYIADTMKIKQNIEGWMAKYPIKPIPNKGYNTVGITVPIDDFSEICEAVMGFVDEAPAKGEV